MSIFEHVARMSADEAQAVLKSYQAEFRETGTVSAGSALAQALEASGIPRTFWTTHTQGLIAEIAVKFLLAPDLTKLAGKWRTEAEDEPEGSPSHSVLLYCAESLEDALAGKS